MPTNGAGLNENGDSQIYNKDGEKVEHIADVIENIDDLKYMGPSVAPWHGGLNTDFSYKGFNLSMLFLGSFGNYFRMPTLRYMDEILYGGGAIMNIEIKDRWKEAGDEKITNIPGVASSQSSDSYDYFNKSDLRVHSADYISLKEIVLSYSFGKNISKKIPFNNITLTAQLRNVAKWVKNSKGIDPESIYSVHYPSMGDPEQMTISFGLKANF